MIMRLGTRIPKRRGPPGQEFLHAHQKPGGFDRTGCYRRVGPFLQRGVKQERKPHNQGQDQKKFAELPDDDILPKGRSLIRCLRRLGSRAFLKIQMSTPDGPGQKIILANPPEMDPHDQSDNQGDDFNVHAIGMDQGVLTDLVSTKDQILEHSLQQPGPR